MRRFEKEALKIHSLSLPGFISQIIIIVENRNEAKWCMINQCRFNDNRANDAIRPGGVDGILDT